MGDKKKLFFLIIIIVTILLTTIFFLLVFFQEKKNIDVSKDEIIVHEEKNQNDVSKKFLPNQDLKDFENEAGPIKCQWSMSETGLIYYYYSDGKNRDLIKILHKDTNQGSYRMNVDGWRYEWRSGEVIGEQTKSTIPNQNYMEKNREEALIYSKKSCEKWNIEEDIFAVPKDIKFYIDND